MKHHTSSEHDPGPRQVRLLDMPLHVVTFREAVSALIHLARGNRPAYAVTANVDHVVRFHRDPHVRHLYTGADLVVADGTPLVWASRLLGQPLPERVAGSDLFPVLCARAAENDLTVFLLGGAPTTADRAAEVMQAKNPGLKIVGTYCPAYGFEHDPEESARIVERVKAAQPDILFVGLGSPKQENWIVTNRQACGARLSIGVGISFSFACGDIARAPRWMQYAGLEWAHRMCQEPRRLCKRYLVDDVTFFGIVLRYLLRRDRTTRS